MNTFITTSLWWCNLINTELYYFLTSNFKTWLLVPFGSSCHHCLHYLFKPKYCNSQGSSATLSLQHEFDFIPAEDKNASCVHEWCYVIYFKAKKSKVNRLRTISDGLPVEIQELVFTNFTKNCHCSNELCWIAADSSLIFGAVK